VQSLVWEHLADRRTGVLLSPLAFSVLFLGVTLLTAYSPGVLTPTTRASLDQIVEGQFSGSKSRYVYALAMFLIQGPYLLGTLSGVMGIQTGQKLSVKAIGSGRFELLLTAPYDQKHVFLSFLAASFVLTLLKVAVFSVLSIGGPLLALDLLFGLQTEFTNVITAVAFLVPIPLALWSNLMVLLGAMGFGTSIYNRFDEVMPLVGIAPAIALVVIVNVVPEVSLFELSVVSIVLTGGVTALCIGWVTRWFDVERVLNTT